MHTVNTLAAGRKTFLVVVTDNIDKFPAVAGSLFRKFTSRQSSEYVKTLTGFGLPVQTNENAAPTIDTRRKLYEHQRTPVKWQVAYEDTDEAKFKDPNNTISQNAMLAAESMAHGRESRRSEVLKYAFTSGYTGPDGLLFADTAHLTNGGPNYANCTSETNGVALSASALNNAKQQARMQPDGKNKKRTPISSWKLVHGPGNIYYARELLNSTLLPGSANNNINSARMDMNDQSVCLDYWDNNSGLGWCILPADVSKSPLYVIQGMPLDVEAIRRDTGADLYKTWEEDVNGWFSGWDSWIDIGA